MSVKYFFDPSYEFVTTTYCDESTKNNAQLWILNKTSNMLFTASSNKKCLSMVPNGININLDVSCKDAKVEGGVKLNGILRSAYKLSLSNKLCQEFLQEYGRWDNQPFSTYSNLVTTYDCFGPDDRSVYSTNRRPDEWIINNQTGIVYNPSSNACMHVGGDAYGRSCYRPTSSPYPAYLFPCDRGCEPEKLQRWIFESVLGSTSLNDTEQLFRIKLRGNPKMCLHNGINEQTTTRWYNHEDPLITGGVTLFLLTLAFVYEMKCSRRRSSSMTPSIWYKSHIFKPDLRWWFIRMFFSMTSCFCASYFAMALSISQIHGGRSYYSRQVVVYGTLLYISIFFVQMVLVARNTSSDSIYGKNKAKEKKGKKRNNFYCIPRLLGSYCLLFFRRCYWFGLVERPTLTIQWFCIFFWRGFAAAASRTKFFLVNDENNMFSQKNYLSAQWLTDTQMLGWWLIIGPIAYTVSWIISHQIAKVRVDLNASAYPSSFLTRWSCILFIQFCVSISGMFTPDGSPSFFPFTSINITVLGIMWELLLGTITERDFEAWAAKYHVVCAVGFSLPLILVNAWELVAAVVSSYNRYGQVYVLHTGAIGGDSNQLRGDPYAVGWWYGPHLGPWIWTIAMVSYCGIIASLFVLPYLVVWLGVRGPKAPSWLSRVLINTGK